MLFFYKPAASSVESWLQHVQDPSQAETPKLLRKAAERDETFKNQDLERDKNWVKNNELVLNISKTKRMVLMDLSLSRITIEQVKNTKLLGVMLDEQLSWSDHIVALIGRVRAMISPCFFVTYDTVPSYGLQHPEKIEINYN